MSEFRIIEGDCIEGMRGLDDGTAQTCITSPPYWGLRDYGAEGQLGLEPTPEEYVANLVAVFREVRRVLRDDGTLWLNLGDSYARQGGDGSHGPNALVGNTRSMEQRRNGKPPSGLKHKDLVGIPWMVAFALRADGWYLRSEIIWHKPAPMPESVRDRPTKSHEQIFLLSKSPRYFYDAEAIREPAQDWGTRDRSGPLYDGTVGPQSGHTGLRDTVRKTARRTVRPGVDTNGGGQGSGEMTYPAHSRNKRSVWTVNTTPFPGAHFATFPPKLIEPCILAGSPPKCCGECGAPWKRITEREPTGFNGATYGERAVEATGGAMSGGTERSTLGSSGGTGTAAYRTTGWRAGCDHNDDTGRAVVLDPFNGAGTTGLVALRHDRDYIGCELNPEYAQMSRDRITDDAPLLNTEVAA